MARVIRHLFGHFNDSSGRYMLPFVPRATVTWRSATWSWQIREADFDPRLRAGTVYTWNIRAGYSDISEFRLFGIPTDPWALTIPFGNGIIFDGATRVDMVSTSAGNVADCMMANTWVGEE